jgi:hypothetical protein
LEEFSNSFLQFAYSIGGDKAVEVTVEIVFSWAMKYPHGSDFF